MTRHLLNPVDAGEVFDVHPETLPSLVRAGKTPGYRVGHSLRFDPDEVREALRSTPAGAARAVVDQLDAVA